MRGLAAGAPALVTGAGGLIGGWITSRLRSMGYRVIATDLPDAKKPAEASEWVPGDICDARFVSELFNAQRPSAVVHCAGLLLFSCENAPRKAIDINVGGTANLIDAAIAVGTHRFVMMSTSAVYGDQTDLIDEHALIGAPHGLLGVYSATKWLAERVGLASSRAPSGPQFVAFRPGFVFGLGQPRSAGLSDVIQRMYGALMRGQRFEISEAGGGERWHFVHVRDVCDAICSAITSEQDPTGVYNLAGPPEMYMSLGEFIAGVRDATGRGGDGSLTGKASSGPRLDMRHFAQRTGFKPSFTIKRAVEHDLDFLSMVTSP